MGRSSGAMSWNRRPMVSVRIAASAGVGARSGIPTASSLSLGQADIAAGVAPGGAEVLPPLGALMEGDDGQQRPEFVPAGKVEFAARVAVEEAAVGGEHHILRVGPIAHPGFELPAGQGDQAPHRAAEDQDLGRVVAGAQPGHQLSKTAIPSRHQDASSPSGHPPTDNRPGTEPGCHPALVQARAPGEIPFLINGGMNSSKSSTGSG